MSSIEIAVPTNAEADTLDLPGRPLFFPVSITKFLLLSIGTLGLYEIYWFYKNWGFIKARDRSDISPRGARSSAFSSAIGSCGVSRTTRSREVAGRSRRDGSRRDG
jgi:hypothetical protein